ncbi:MAG: flagellar assembly protein FliW [Magnetococcales bacterium]|nr:flagellar assembly protein FliW [Magnetococcales bacterium]MBF0262827.1 flagellar assembly protein FliW [Magnetococcales bacterium]
MEVLGTRFGTLKYKEDELITLDAGMMGFPNSKRYLMFPYSEDSSFFWLQSADEPEIAFIVINPFDFFSDLEFLVEDEDIAAIGLERGEDLEVFSLLTIPDNRPEEMRTNLAGPVVVNVRNRRGRQVVIKEYSARQPLIPFEMRGAYREQTRGKKPVKQMVAVS